MFLVQGDREKERKSDVKNDPRFLFMQKLANNPSSEITKKLLKQRFALPIEVDPNNK